MVNVNSTMTGNTMVNVNRTMTGNTMVNVNRTMTKKKTIVDVALLRKVKIKQQESHWNLIAMVKLEDTKGVIKSLYREYNSQQNNDKTMVDITLHRNLKIEPQ